MGEGGEVVEVWIITYYTSKVMNRVNKSKYFFSMYDYNIDIQYMMVISKLDSIGNNLTTVKQLVTTTKVL